MFVDLQVNGYAGVDFNSDDLSLEGLERACTAIQRDGTGQFLATIISDSIEAMCERLARLVALRERDREIARAMVGVHIEGPFINPQDGYRGAHPADAMVAANDEDMKRLLDAAGGLTRIVTLAPERDERLAVTKMLAKQKIVVSAGHTNATVQQLCAACDAGLSMFTHLGNGCPMMMHRHDNIIQRALSLRERLWVCFIADGVHVPFFALGNYIRAAGVDRCIVVTDAMAAAGLGPGVHRLGRWEVSVGEDGAAWAPDHSHLVGSAMSMRRAAENLKYELGLNEGQCRKLLHDHAAEVLEV